MKITVLLLSLMLAISGCADSQEARRQNPSKFVSAESAEIGDEGSDRDTDTRTERPVVDKRQVNERQLASALDRLRRINETGTDEERTAALRKLGKYFAASIKRPSPLATALATGLTRDLAGTEFGATAESCLF
jgi:hypothetical protein